MNIDLKNVASIVDNSNNKEVEKIVWNYNNEMIWGSYSKYPYRRLEYIHFSGSEWLDSGYTPTGGTSCRLRAKWGEITTTGDGNNVMLGSYDSQLTNTSRRLYWLAAGNGYFRHVSGNTWTNSIGTDNNIHTFTIGFSSDFKTSYWTIRRADESSTGMYSTSLTNSTAYTGFGASFGIGCQHNRTGIDPNRYSIIDVYYFRVKNGQDAWGTGNVPRTLVPCQRKSDNVCGLYDINNSTFIPMQGTNITNAAAGPVINEYWDMTS